MHEYTITPEGFKQLYKQSQQRRLLFMALALATATIMILVNAIRQGEDLISYLPGLPIALIFFGFSFYRASKKQKTLLQNYKLVLTNNLISRELNNLPTISIYFNEIKEIVQDKKGNPCVKGKNKMDAILVPTQMENYSAIEAALNEIVPITKKSHHSFLEKYRMPLILLMLGLMACVYTVNNKIIVAISGTAVSAALIAGGYEIIKSKHTDAKTKRSVWTFVIVLGSVIAVMVYKLKA